MPQNTVFCQIIIMLGYGTVPASVYQSLNRKIFSMHIAPSRLHIAHHSGLYYTTCICSIHHFTQCMLF